MAPNLNLMFAAPPDQTQAALSYGVPVAHMAYRLGPGPALLRSAVPASLQGGLMMMDDQGCGGGRGDPLPFCRQVARECAARGFQGVVADWDSPLTPALGRLARALDQTLAEREWPLYLPEDYGSHEPHARLLVSSALSGGSLRQRLTEALAQHGRERVVLALERAAEDFPLPAPKGCGTPLRLEELRQMMRRLHPNVYFSEELCAQYFTYRSQDGQVRLVLYDSQDSLRQKLQTARNAGVARCLMAYPQVADLLPGLLR